MRAAIVLAAGGSRRFGRGDKLLALLHGRPLLLHAIDRARESGARRICVVVSSERARRLLRGRGVTTIWARDAATGLSASLAAGLRALQPIEREVFVFLGDMPLAAVPRRMRIPAGANGVRPIAHGRPGHPMLLRIAAAKGARLRGDRGLSALDRIAAVRGEPGNLLDIDSRAGLRAARLGSGARPPR